MKFFTVREAKKRFSEVVETSQDEIVIITNHGRPVAAIIGIKNLNLDDLCKDDRLETIQIRLDGLRSNEGVPAEAIARKPPPTKPKKPDPEEE